MGQESTQETSTQGFMWIMMLNSNVFEGVDISQYLTQGVQDQIFGYLGDNPGFIKTFRPELTAALQQANPKGYAQIGNQSQNNPVAGGDFNFAVINEGTHPEFDAARAIEIANSDNARSGYCAKGVANILKAQGIPCQRGNAHDWDSTLPQNGWVMVERLTPENAPPGSVLVFDSDTHMGKTPRGTGGGKYGHVEIVAETVDGDRMYISDRPQDKWGGSVPDNFVGVYVYAPDGLELNNDNTLVAENEQDGEPDFKKGQPATGPAPETSADSFEVAATGQEVAPHVTAPSAKPDFSQSYTA